ncbi:hypothetical protein Fcan01_08142 [Folsomia candida]|uniref:Uncharacterized protein n=1 Tax=Folsomia candida TaxID=158441 RepID=A0A226EJH2_FOLCA|nr:hypothetical protein Fcan01_08142 [Folsomia candida]
MELHSHESERYCLSVLHSKRENRGLYSSAIIDIVIVVGSVAEWEYLGSGLAELDTPSEKTPQLSPSSFHKFAFADPYNLSPSRRIGPATWLDVTNGNWWLFGGQGPTTNQSAPVNYLSDLWVYAPPPSFPKGSTPADRDDPSHWKLVYRPENDGDGPLSVHQEDVVFPLMCGSESSGHLALFKGGQNWAGGANTASSATDNNNALFSEDGVVWVSDIPKSFKALPRKRGVKSGGDGSGCRRTGGGRRRSSCNSTMAAEEEGGLQWTSYICCDACLPDGNSTFDFCPQFSHKPILWCNQDSIMAFQLLPPVSGPPSITSKPKREISSVASGEPTSTFSSSTSSTTFISQSQIPKVSQQGNFSEQEESSRRSNAKMGKASSNSTQSHISLATPFLLLPEWMKNGGNSQGEGQPEKLRGGERNTIQEDNEKRTTEDNGSSIEGGEEKVAMKPQQQENQSGAEVFLTSRASTLSNARSNATTTFGVGVERNLLVNWWKFDLTAREWMKMPEVNLSSMSKATVEQIRAGNCRSVSDSVFLYILCPTKTNLLDRSLFLFDPNTSSIHSLGTIHLNNAFFHDRKVWQLGRSALHALRSDNQSVIFLAYNKLLDLWVHDHSSNQITPVENVWRGSSLHAFQHTSSFYKLSVVFPPPSSSSGSGGAGEDKRKEHTTFMVNPRSFTKLYNFQDPYPDGHFKITIVTDRSVFLPSRDAPTLINSTDFPDKSLLKERNETLVAITKTQSLSLVEMLTKGKQKKNTDKTPFPEQEKDRVHDQRIHSQISITNPNTKPFIGESSSQQHVEHDDESHKQKDKTEHLDHHHIEDGRPKTLEGAGGGLSKSQDLSSYMNMVSAGVVAVVGESRSREGDQVSISRSSMDNTEKSTRKTAGATVSDVQNSREEKTHETSQSKSNPGLSTLKNYNKTNNLSVKAGGVDVQVISGKQNKRILGVKRTTKTAMPETTNNKIDSPHSNSPHPAPITSTTKDEAADIGGESRRGDSANEMRSLVGRGSLPVNNESNGKPLLPQAHTTFTFGESQNHANFNSGAEPRVLAVVRTGMQLTEKMTSRNSDHRHPSTLTSSIMPQVTTASPNATKWWRSGGGGGGADHQANFSKNGVNLSMTSSTPLEASTLKVAPGSGGRSGGQERESLPANLETKTNQFKNSSTWTLPKSVNHSSSTVMTEEEMDGENHNTNHHDQERDEPNLENNYVSPRRTGKWGSRNRKNNNDVDVKKGLMSHSASLSLPSDGNGGNESSFMGDMAGGGHHLTSYGSSILIDSSQSDQKMQQSVDGESLFRGEEDEEVGYSSYSTFGSLIFFSLSISIFASFGLFVFVRRCVRCPSTSESVLLKEPPIRYSVVPDELYPHTPLV